MYFFQTNKDENRPRRFAPRGLSIKPLLSAEFYFPSFLWINLTISMIGMISNCKSQGAMQYSSRSMGVKSKALANAGISITAVVRIRDAIIAANRKLIVGL